MLEKSQGFSTLCHFITQYLGIQFYMSSIKTLFPHTDMSPHKMIWRLNHTQGWPHSFYPEPSTYCLADQFGSLNHSSVKLQKLKSFFYLWNTVTKDSQLILKEIHSQNVDNDFMFKTKKAKKHCYALKVNSTNLPSSPVSEENPTGESGTHKSAQEIFFFTK